jgi:hypothetical protein
MSLFEYGASKKCNQQNTVTMYHNLIFNFLIFYLWKT